jgi:glycine cleavage system aminomethyltransferase T
MRMPPVSCPPEIALQVLEQLTEQDPVFCKAKYTVRAFTIRRNEKIAVRCTVRGEKAFELLEKVCKTAVFAGVLCAVCGCGWCACLHALHVARRRLMNVFAAVLCRVSR